MAFENRQIALDPKALLEHRSRQVHMLDAKSDRSSQCGAGQQRIAEDPKIRDPLALARQQANGGIGAQPQHIAKQRQLLPVRDAQFGVADRLQRNTRSLEQRICTNAKFGKRARESGQALHAVGKRTEFTLMAAQDRWSGGHVDEG